MPGRIKEKLFRLEIILPDRVFYANEVRMAEYNTVMGEVGVYAEHIPMTQIIAPGVLVITEEKGAHRAALLSGFAKIMPQTLCILAETAEWGQDIDAERARQALIRAKRRLEAAREGVPGIDKERAKLAFRRAAARLQAAADFREN